MEFKKWQKIQQFHNTKKSVMSAMNYKLLTDEDSKFPIIEYRAKVKLDGTNAAIRFENDEVAAQSRSRIITSEDDNFGFASFVETISDWTSRLSALSNDMTIYGEWCGKGIQKRCSVSKCERMFVIFSVDIEGVKITNPDDISILLLDLPTGVFLLPWYGDEITVNYSSQKSIESAVNLMCEHVEIVEKCDPWVDDTFGIKGLGEGLVYYNIGGDFGCLSRDTDLMFKAKGEKHKGVIQLKPIIIDPERVSSVTKFVNKFVTENRLNQCLIELQLEVLTVKDTGMFLKWIGNDVRSESQDELEISGLTWKDVAKEVNQRARSWFFERLS